MSTGLADFETPESVDAKASNFTDTSGISDFASSESSTGSDTLDLKIMSREYTESDSGTIIHLFGRDSSGEKYHVEVDNHHPSFFIHEREYNQRIDNHYAVSDTEAHDANGERYTSLHDEPLVRIYTTRPSSIDEMTELFDETFEADVLYQNRWSIDNDIFTGVSIDTSAATMDEPWVTGDMRVPTRAVQPLPDDANPCSQMPKMLVLDIEVASEAGVPSVDTAEWPVSSIVAWDSYSEEYIGWLFLHDDHNRDAIESTSLHEMELDDLRTFDDESSLLYDFNEWVSDLRPDVITGWFSNDFDIPYLVTRCKNLTTYNYRQWSPLGNVYTTNYGPTVDGVECVDMIGAYEKTQIHNLKDKSLDAIAEKELDSNKIELGDDDGSLSHTEMWKQQPVEFLRYNKVDVELVHEIDAESGAFNLLDNLRQIAGVAYSDLIGGTFEMMDILFLRKAQQYGYVLPTAEKPEVGDFHGAYVYTPKSGLHEHAVYPDYSCFTDGHEIMTPTGPQPVEELSVGDTVYTLDEETHTLVEDTVTDTHKYGHDGDVYDIDGTVGNMQITPDHNVYVGSANADSYDGHDFTKRRIDSIERDYSKTANHTTELCDGPSTIDIAKTVEDVFMACYVDDGRTARHKLPSVVTKSATRVKGYEDTIDGSEKKWTKYLLPIDVFRRHRDVCLDAAAHTHAKVAKGCRVRKTEFDADDLTRLAAWYTAEGSAASSSPHRVKIANEDLDHLDRIASLLDSMDIPYYRNEHGVSFSHGVLRKWLVQNCGADSHSKTVPDYVYGTVHGQAFLDVLIDGDGSRRDNSQTYYTASETLASDVSVLAVESGYKPRITSRDRSASEYEVYIREHGGLSDDNITVESYDGMVHCITAAENHVVMAGRDGYFEWVGQCLYPNMMYQCNISPETLVGTTDELVDSEYDESDCVWTYIDTTTPPAEKPDREAREEDMEKFYFVDPSIEEGFVRSVLDDIMGMCDEYTGDMYSAAKRSRNASYGYLGDSDSYGTGSRMFDWRLAEGTTLGGQRILKEGGKKFTKFVTDDDAEVIYGDSVPADEPVTVKNTIKAAEDVSIGDEVWTDNGWSEVNDVIEKPAEKQLYTVRTKRGVTHVTEDHGLLRPDGTEVTPTEVGEGDKLLHDEPTLPHSESNMNRAEAWTWGVFAAEGSCGAYDTEYGTKNSWAVSNQNTSLLRCLGEALPFETNICTANGDDDTHKLQLSGNGFGDDAIGPSVVAEWRERHYNGDQKVVPVEILTAERGVKMAFLCGFHAGDGHMRDSVERNDFDEMWSKSKLLAHGLDSLLTSLGYETTVSYRRNHGGEYYRVRVVEWHKGATREVTAVEPYDYDDVVYDFETANHHFHAGVGDIIVHNTDSVVTTFPNAESGEHALEMGFGATEQTNEWLQPFTAETFGLEDESESRMELELESYSSGIFFKGKDGGTSSNGVKKRYAQKNMWDDDNMWLDEPELEIKGFEYVRSDVADVTADVQYATFDTLLSITDEAAQRAVQRHVEGVITDMMHGEYPLSDVGIPFGISKHPSEYGSPDQTPQPQYRGAKFANEFLYGGDEIQSGDKPLYYYIQEGKTGEELRSTYSAETAEDGRYVDAVSVTDAADMPDDLVIDREKMVKKTVIDPMKEIFVTLGWGTEWMEDAIEDAKEPEDYRDDEQQGLDAFSDPALNAENFM